MAQLICKDLTLGYENGAILENLSFSVEKGEERGRTLTRVTELSRPERALALARLTGGEHVSEAMLRGAEELLSAADLMVHPARNEATGTVLAEAAVCGLPVICSENCGYAPLVKDAGGVVLPENGGSQAVRDALELTLTLPDALNRLRTSAREYAGKVDFYHRTECFWDHIEEKTAHA